MKLVFIARVIGVLETTVWKVLHDDLGMKGMLDSKASYARAKTCQEKHFPKRFDSFTSC
jgi:hypothetical protein